MIIKFPSRFRQNNDAMKVTQLGISGCYE
jgi:hypothetical protein